MLTIKRRRPFPSHSDLTTTYPSLILTKSDYRFAYLYYAILVLEYVLYQQQELQGTVPSCIGEDDLYDVLVREAMQRALTMRLG